MSADKLPEWPDITEYSAPGVVDVARYNGDLAYAALARMEALRQYVTHNDDCAWEADWMNACTCGLFALSAACERSAPQTNERREG